ncbi:MAG TPA: hypothetical protein VHF25_05840 [Nitriliruptorales bacterium]|nr:hypothetical protein [Nitriliruptorales bacterium]
MGVTVQLDPAEPTAGPGELARCELHVRNTAGRADEFTPEVIGEPAAWAWTEPPTLRLPAGEEGTARLRFRLPEAAVPAGRLPFAVRIVSASDDGVAAEVDGALHVQVRRELSVALTPARSPSRRGAELSLRVENRGNVPVRVRLRAADGPGRGRRVRVVPCEVDVEPGGAADARVAVRVGRPLLRGERLHGVTVEVVPDDGPALHASATVVQQARLPRWAWLAAGVALVLAAGLALRGPSLAPDADGAAAVGRDLPGRSAGVAPSACPVDGHLGPSGNVLTDGEIRSVGRGRPMPRDHAFLMAAADGCSPVRFDPCQPVHYVVNPALAPFGEALSDVHAAFARVAEASGLRFVFDGTTDETFPGPGRDFTRRAYQPERYGERWPPLLVAWSSGAFVRRGDIESGRVVAGGGHPTLEGDVLVTAQVTLNADAVIDLETGEPVPAGFGPGITWGRVLLHELGHAVGLGHVSDAAQLMHEPLTDHPPIPSEYAAGDRAGLRLVGRELGCLQTPPVPAGHP